MEDISSLIKAEASSLGFSFISTARISQSPHFPQFMDWLSSGYSGEMEYLSRERTIKSRENPASIMRNVKSMLVFGLVYQPLTAAPPEFSTSSRPYGIIASYAAHQDYHHVLKNKAHTLMDRISGICGKAIEFRVFVDSTPLMEKDSAYMAGAGWIGKNSLLITPENGSYQLIGCILSDLDLPFQEPFQQDLCGTCRQCIQTCPTECITAYHSIDASRCIAYLTIEHKGIIPRELRPKMGQWIFGCDICQNACPINKKVRPLQTNSDSSLTIEINPVIDLMQEFELRREEFQEKYQDTPVMRLSLERFRRNLIIAMGNSRSTNCIPLLCKVIFEETNPVLRVHAVWALGRINTLESCQIIRKILGQEKDEKVLEEIQLTLKETD